jgi:hypothetical protein
MKRVEGLLFLLLIGLGGYVQSAGATPIELVVTAKPEGYSANGTYEAVLLGEGYDWTVTLRGNPDGYLGKPPVDMVLILLWAYGHQIRLPLKAGTTTTGFNTSDGGAYNNTGQWEQPSTDGGNWIIQWNSRSADQAVAPYGQNLFSGTFTLDEPATSVEFATVYLESTSVLGIWYGEANVTPDRGATLWLLGAGMACLGVFRRWLTVYSIHTQPFATVPRTTWPTDVTP